MKNILPALGNEFITLIKETAVVGYVAVQDLTKAAELIQTGHTSRSCRCCFPRSSILCW